MSKTHTSNDDSRANQAYFAYLIGRQAYMTAVDLEGVEEEMEGQRECFLAALHLSKQRTGRRDTLAFNPFRLTPTQLHAAISSWRERLDRVASQCNPSVLLRLQDRLNELERLGERRAGQDFQSRMDKLLGCLPGLTEQVFGVEWLHPWCQFGLTLGRYFVTALRVAFGTVERCPERIPEIRSVITSASALDTNLRKITPSLDRLAKQVAASKKDGDGLHSVLASQECWFSALEYKDVQQQPAQNEKGSLSGISQKQKDAVVGLTAADLCRSATSLHWAMVITHFISAYEPREHIFQRPSTPIDERNAYIVELYKAVMPLKQIIHELQRVAPEKGWEPITTVGGINKAIRKHEERTGEHVPRRLKASGKRRGAHNKSRRTSFVREEA